tara:strand:- start:1371 stop:2135 length:765 start_codon:yes stop_codon:yes gene_type:complete
MRQLQGAFLEAVRRVSPEQAHQLHEGSQEKPYTLGLMERMSQKRGFIKRFQFRVTLLDDAFFPLVLQLQATTHDEPLMLGKQPFKIQSIHTGTGHYAKWTGFSPWSKLLSDASTQHIVHLRLDTPVSFRQSQKEKGTRLEMPLPLPELVLGSALRKWQLWSGEVLDEELRKYLSSAIEITWPFSLESHEVEFHIRGTTRRVVGCTGQITYRLHHKQIPKTVLQQMNALASSLFYTGAGVRTAFGMGRLCQIEQP